MTKRRANNSGSYQQRGNRHVIQWSSDGKRRTKSYPTEIEARTALSEMDKLKLGKNTDKSSNIAKLFKNWIEEKDPTPTFYGYWVRFNKHWEPIIGNLKPNELDGPLLKAAMPIFKKNGLSKSSIGLLFRILSSFLSEMVEDGLMEKNPVSLLSKKGLKGPSDPAKVQFIKKLEDISRVYTWLNGYNKSVSIAFSIGVLAGLRINEIRGLSWQDIDFNNKVINIKWQAGTSRFDGADRLRPPKSQKSRIVPISNDLYKILQNWFETTRGEGWLVRPEYSNDVNKKFIGKDTLRLTLKKCLRVLKLPKLTWYSATRHTFASQWVIAGGSLVKLKEIMGHASFSTTERAYIHLIPGQFSETDRNVLQIELKNYEKMADWKLLEINSKVRGDLLPSDGHWNERDSRPNGQ